MNENKNPLNDFLEMEEQDSELFSDLPFNAPAIQPVVQNAQAQSPTPAESTVVGTQVMQAPQPTEQPPQPVISKPPQASLFEEAVAKTPIAAQTPATNPPAEVPVQQNIADADDPFTAALASAKAQAENRLVEVLANRDAVFCYGKAKEPIIDRDYTFEDLREKYESDFPELSESKKVEWTVTYGFAFLTIGNGPLNLFAIG